MSPVSKVLAFLLCCFASAQTRGLEAPGYPLVQVFTDTEFFRNIDTQFALTQTDDRMLISGVSDSFFTFDGRTWTRFKIPGVDAMMSVARDFDGRIIVTTFEHPGYLQPGENGELEMVSLHALLPREQSNAKVFTRAVPARDGVYFNSFNRMFRWDRGSRIDSWETDDIFPYVVTVDNQPFVSIGAKGLFRINGHALELVPGSVPGSGKKSETVTGTPEKLTAAAPFRDGWLMVTEHDGFRFFDGETVVPIELGGSEVLRRLPGQVVSFEKIGTGGFVAADNLSNLLFFDPTGNAIGRWSPRDFPGLTTASVFVDLDGKVWTATANGVVRLQLESNVRVLDERAGWEAIPNMVYAVGDKRLFSVGLKTYEWVQGQFPGSGSLRERPDLGSVIAAADGDIFYTLRQGDPVMCAYADGRIEEVLPAGTWFPRPSPRERDLIYLEEFPSKLWKFRKANGRWQFEGEPLPVSFHLSDTVEGPRHLWFTLGEGRVARASRGQQLKDVRVFTTADGLPVQWVRAFDCGDEVLFATRQGIYRFDEAKSRFEPDPRFMDVPREISRDFRSIQTDPSGNIWLGSSDGSGILRRHGDGTYSWDLGSLSVLGGVIIQNLIWDPAGWMWCFAGGRLFVIRPELGKREDPGFAVTLQQVRDLNKNKVLFGAYRRPDAPPAVLTYEQNALRFEISAPEFSAPGAVEFQSKLQGHDREWTKWNSGRVFQYPALHEGRYVFEFRARDAFGHAVTGRPFAFTIKPPFYRTWAAYLTYVFMLGGLVWVGALLYSRRLRVQNLTLEQLVRERTHDLAKTQRELIDSSRLAGMAEVATGVLHNVGNTLNSVNVSASLIAEYMQRSGRDPLGKIAALFQEHEHDLGDFLTRDPKGKLVPKYLQSAATQASEERELITKELSHLTTGIDRIKEIVSMQQVYASTSAFSESLDPAALMEDSLRLSRAAVGRRDDVAIVRSFEPVPHISAQRGKVLQILVTLIENAIQACRNSGRADSEITLSIEQGPSGTVRMIVSDTGIGIAPENLTRIFAHGFTTRTGGRGYGLHMAANAATEMNGSLTVASEGTGKGARFTLVLPVATETQVPEAQADLTA